MKTIHQVRKSRHRLMKSIMNPVQDYTMLRGIDVEAEFLKIKQKTSTLSAQMRSLVVARVQYLEAMKKDEKDIKQEKEGE